MHLQPIIAFTVRSDRSSPTSWGGRNSRAHFAAAELRLLEITGQEGIELGEKLYTLIISSLFMRNNSSLFMRNAFTNNTCHLVSDYCMPGPLLRILNGALSQHLNTILTDIFHKEIYAQRSKATCPKPRS